jgi:hypothetical protein
MLLERYGFSIGPEKGVYNFFSWGPNGRIKKIVFFDRLPETEAELYNLAFGDWKEATGQVDDLAISNNNDRQKILATVAAIVVHFMQEHPDAVVSAAGSTLSRNRLYQMGITRHTEEIGALFQVKGYYEGAWEPFEKGKDYTAFLIRK